MRRPPARPPIAVFVLVGSSRDGGRAVPYPLRQWKIVMIKYQAGSAFLSLFGSMATLMCCALPATFVFLGAGASFAALISAFPQLVVISQYKSPLFIGTALLLVCSFYLQFIRPAACPADPVKGRACVSAKKLSKYALYFASLAYLTGFSFAFILPAFI